MKPDREAGNGDSTWEHRWGFADTRFMLNQDGSVTLTGDRYDMAGYRMYDFLPYVEEVLGVQLDWNTTKPEIDPKPIPEGRRNSAFCQAVEASFDARQYSFDDRIRLIHSHGQTTADEVYQVLYERLDRCADMVFFCESEANAQDIIRLAGVHGVCLVPYGGGTSVSSALQLPARERRMIVVVNMRRMNRVEWIDELNLRACAQSGISGQELERKLAARGFTSGHEPDSIELSTLGGWISTNASGMKKNRYGNIEQIVENITLITPQGRIEQVEALSRASLGMQPQNLLFGSEGNLGLITKAVIKIHPLPEVKKYGSLVFPNFEQGTRFLRQLARSAYRPASVRLVDNVQFRFGQALKPRSTGYEKLLDRLKKFYLLRLRGFDVDQIAATTIVMEGSSREVKFQEANIYRLAKDFQGIPAGADAGRRGYMLTFAIAYIRDFLSDYHVIGETFETSVSWSRIGDVCRAVKETADREHRRQKLPGKAYVSYRITQLYHTGVCIYFMFGIYTRGVKRPDRVFSRMEHRLREAILRNGGSISHHHGVGKIRKDFMNKTLSASSIDLLLKLKQSSDPENTFAIGNNVFAQEG